jgi:heme/copper-type cytochrome/quinol oxidase subunit 4
MNHRLKIKAINLTTWLIFFLAIVNVALHLYFSKNLEYHRDELLYFSLGMHPAFGYATVPPMIGWIAWIMQNLFGYSVFAVRLFPALMSGVMVFLISAIAKELGGSGYARILAAVGVMVSGFGLRTFLLFMPVHIYLILWTLLFYLIVRYINTYSDKYLILIGITVGIALLNKYLIGLLLLILLIIIPFTRYRTIFRDKKFLYGLLAGLIVFLPNLIWQIVNGLPVINHLGELARTQLVNVSKTSFLIDQFASPTAASILTVAGIIYLFINRDARKYRFLGLAVISVIVTLMLLQGKSYYTQGVFPFLIAAGAVSWEKILKTKLSRLFLLLLILMLTWPVIPIGVPVYKKERLVKYFNRLSTKYGMGFMCRFEDNSIHSLPQDYADMLGWKELTAVAARAWDMVPDKRSAFIYGENYGLAGAITVIGKTYNLPEAVCFSESFRYWIPRRFDPDIKSLVYINDEPGNDIKELFRKITKVGSISDPDAREFGTSVYLCEDPVSSFNEFWTARIKNIN